MPYFRIVTFGCKVNQFESAGMAEALVGLGFEWSPSETAPDVIVVNTCTVTSRADQQARQTVRRLAREHPGAQLWVTGCYAQRAPEELAALPGVAKVLGNREKADLAKMLSPAGENSGTHIQVQDFAPREPFQVWPVQNFPGHTRAWLKVQDGCNHACSYCIVPSVRGPSRSLLPEEVTASLEALGSRGYQEVVLTGIDLGQYGQDLSPPSTLAGLLHTLAPRPWPFRVRLSSLEPQEVTPELLEALAAFPDLCPHFHLPLQSGAARVLQAMARPYRPEHFRDLVLELHRRFPLAALGLDILVGFPGETEADFEATRVLVENLPVTYLHVFPFSPRPGTAAHTLRPLPGKEVQRRARIMRELGRLKKTAFYQAQVGMMGEVLVEGPGPRRPGWLRGLSPNYLRVLIPGPPEWRNRRLTVKFLQVQGEIIVGEVIPSENNRVR